MEEFLPRLVIAGSGSGSGKTTVVCGILTALKNRGIRVSAFKCGPDYIDPMFHERALGVPSKNLDSFFCDKSLLRGLFAEQARKGEIDLIEGVMGYYDGLGASTAASTYEIASSLKAPAVLVLNGKGMSLTAAALIKGVVQYKRDSNIRAVILNNVSEKTYLSLKYAIEAETGVIPLGFLPNREDFAVESRHLGLVTPHGIEDLSRKLQGLGQAAEEYIDIDRLIEIGRAAPNIDIESSQLDFEKKANVTVAVARDEAFCFYYKDNLELLEKLGCKLIFFSPLRDKTLPKADGLILGGGYPELYLKELSSNREMLRQIKAALEQGMPCLAECGGFMYLHKTVEDKEGKAYNMAGLIEGRAFYGGRLVRLGYESLTARKDCFALEKGGKIKAHEYHYWDTTAKGGVFTAEKPTDNSLWDCITEYKNTLCGFPHIYYYSNPRFAKGFVSRCKDYKEKKRCLF